MNFISNTYTNVSILGKSTRIASHHSSTRSYFVCNIRTVFLPWQARRLTSLRWLFQRRLWRRRYSEAPNPSTTVTEILIWCQWLSTYGCAKEAISKLLLKVSKWRTHRGNWMLHSTSLWVTRGHSMSPHPLYRFHHALCATQVVIAFSKLYKFHDFPSAIGRQYAPRTTVSWLPA